MSALAERLVRAREEWVRAGAHEFLVRRPALLALAGVETRALVCRAVVGWRNVTEGDVFDGGSSRPVQFEAALAEEWLSDRPDLFAPVLEKLEMMITAYSERRASAEKNSA